MRWRATAFLARVRPWATQNCRSSSDRSRNEAHTQVRSLSSVMVELLQERASFNRAFSPVEPTYCRGDGRGRKEGEAPLVYAYSDREATAGWGFVQCRLPSSGSRLTAPTALDSSVMRSSFFLPPSCVLSLWCVSCLSPDLVPAIFDIGACSRVWREPLLLHGGS